MKCFQILGVALVAASAFAAPGSFISGPAYSTISSSSGYGLAAAAPLSYGVVSAAAPAATYSLAAAPAASYSVAAAPVATTALVHAAPAAYSVAAAAPTAAIVHAAAPSIRSHEIHTGGAANSIRVEEHRAAGQLIRVHDSAQAPTQVINVQGPAAAGDHIRLVSRTGPTQVQRQVYQNPNTQVFDVVNPPKPADRVINIRGAPAPPARVELVADRAHAAPEIHVGGNEATTQVVHAGPALGAVAAAPAISTISAYSAPASYASYAAPASYASYAAPASYASYAAPASYASYAAPASYASYAAPAAYSSLAVPTYGASTYGHSYGHGYGSAATYGSTAVLHKA